MARTRLTLAVPGMQDHPEQGAFDPLHPKANAPVAAYLAAAGCPLTGQVLAVRGGTVTMNQGWSRGAQVTKSDACWEVEELAHALDELPCDDQFDKLVTTLGRALGTEGRDQIQQMINTLLDEDSRSGNEKAV
jgi:hypothetical protein